MYQSTVFGLAAKLPFKYTGAVVLGTVSWCNMDVNVIGVANPFFYAQNLAGTIVALINIMSITMSPNARTAAIYYFITALFILLACFDTYFALPLNVSISLLPEAL